jgi:hypothetical protein
MGRVIKGVFNEELRLDLLFSIKIYSKQRSSWKYSKPWITDDEE